MTHYVVLIVSVAYWLLCGMGLFALVLDEYQDRLTKVNIIFDLGTCLMFGGLVVPILVGASTIYCLTRLKG